MHNNRSGITFYRRMSFPQTLRPLFRELFSTLSLNNSISLSRFRCTLFSPFSLAPFSLSGLFSETRPQIQVDYVSPNRPHNSCPQDGVMMGALSSPSSKSSQLCTRTLAHQDERQPRHRRRTRQQCPWGTSSLDQDSKMKHILLFTRLFDLLLCSLLLLAAAREPESGVRRNDTRRKMKQ